MLGSNSKHRPELTDLAIELAQQSASLRASLPAGVIEPLVNLVRTMNCYYSNLIEGHVTHPIDIERAMQGNYSLNPTKRNLQLEAKAHITVQTWIDEGGLKDTDATNTAVLLEIHKRFCELMPAELLVVKDPESDEEAVSYTHLTLPTIYSV